MIVISFLIRMLPSVKFNDKLSFKADKVNNIALQDMLTSEFPALKSPTSQMESKTIFCISLISAQFFLKSF